MSPGDPRRVSLATIAIEWGRIGVTGFGGPPAHIGLLRRLCVERRGWLSAREFEDGIAATGLLRSRLEVVDGRQRRRYRATPQGRKALGTCRRALRELAGEVLARR